MPRKTLCLHYNDKLLSDVFRQTFAVYCVNKTNNKNRLCGRNAKVFNVVADATCGNQRALKVN